MLAHAVWQSRPVFVTSTFRDMQAERDWLHAHVFPVLAERLRARFHHLEPIDLRWGVETVSAGEQQAKELLVLKVCLAEIKRSRPFLIALLGDRYGWRPPEVRMYTAAQEAGFAADLRGKSVTALEIEFGILDSPEQRKLSRFYFRAPLPYDKMDPADAAIYSDLHSGEPGAAEAHGRLDALKARIRRQMPDRWRLYAGNWDPEARKVTGLEAWGEQVLEDVWSDLEEATREYAQAAPATWQQEEAYVLEQFLEEKSHDFVGREETVEELTKFALSPASPDAPWGKAVTGGPGSGKSALFAHLARKLAKQDVLLLAHAAGISARSGQVDIVLRRWIGELAPYLGETDPSEALTGREDMEKKFAELLSRAAQRTRVVCLVDALNQFERTPAARHLTWLPELWPANARLLATAISGTESHALAAKRGCAEALLPTLGEAEASAIIDTVCARHHKRLHPEVRAALLGRRLADGGASRGIPLWLELAAEELLLLDADDFARLCRFAGNPEQQLHSLMLAVAGEMPAEVEGLCGYLLKRTEDQYGEKFARAFAELIAVSRTGWRETDLRALIPAISGEAWVPLRFAGLRRAFRSQLVQRGALGQWDFAHAQMRAAVERGALADLEQRLARHRQIAAYISGLDGDPLRQSELMFHLIRGDLRREAAELYTGPVIDAAEATAALASYVLEGQTRKAGGELEWVLSLASQELSDDQIRTFCVRLGNLLDPALADDAPVAVRRRVAEAAVEHLEELLRRAPDSADNAGNLAASYSNLGDLQMDLGALDRALELYQKSCALEEDLWRRAPDSADHAKGLAVSYSRLGSLHEALGAQDRALEFHRRSCELMEELRRRAPDSADYADNLAMSYSRLGDQHRAQGEPGRALESYEKFRDLMEDLWRRVPDSTGYAKGLALSCSKLGDVHEALGALDRALEFLQKSRDLMEELRRRVPDSADNARELAVSYSKLGSLHLALGALGRALEFLQKSRDLMEELHRRVPDSAGYARELARSYSVLGELQMTMGAPDRALEPLQKCHDLMEELWRRTPDSSDYAHLLALSCFSLGDLQQCLGAPDRALEFYQEALGRMEELRRRAPDSADYARDMAASYSKLGDLQMAQGAPDRALEFYQKPVGIMEELRRRAPDSADYAYVLAVSYSRLGDLHRALLEPGRALEFYERFCALVEELGRQSPDSTRYTSELGISYGKMGDLHLALGATERALECYERCHQMSEALRRRVPESADYQKNLAVSYRRLGDVHLALGKTANSLTFYQNAVEIMESLVKRSAKYAYTLGLCYEKVGQLHQAVKAQDLAGEAYRKSLPIWESLNHQAPDSHNHARGLTNTHLRLGDLALEAGQPGKAIGHYKRLLELLDDAERRWPSLPPDDSMTNGSMRQRVLTQIRGAALASYDRGEYAEAEEALERLAGRGFEPASTGCHLARLYLLTGRDLEARAAVEKAWRERAGARGYVPPRILFLRALLAMLAGENPLEELRALKPLLGPEDAHMEWTIAPVLDHLARRLGSEDLAFLRALASALGDRAALPALEAQERWRNAG